MGPPVTKVSEKSEKGVFSLTKPLTSVLAKPFFSRVFHLKQAHYFCASYPELGTNLMGSFSRWTVRNSTDMIKGLTVNLWLKTHLDLITLTRECYIDQASTMNTANGVICQWCRLFLDIEEIARQANRSKVYHVYGGTHTLYVVAEVVLTPIIHEGVAPPSVHIGVGDKWAHGLLASHAKQRTASLNKKVYSHTKATWLCQVSQIHLRLINTKPSSGIRDHDWSEVSKTTNHANLLVAVWFGLV